MAGYVYTNENCIGCNRCISVCPVLTANQAVVVDGKPRIEVNHAQCINCGACFDACEHQAREYADDTEQFFADLQRGESISLLLAPAFLANYPREYEQILGGLRQMGQSGSSVSALAPTLRPGRISIILRRISLRAGSRSRVLRWSTTSRCMHRSCFRS